jgi:K+-sensing histidine kinase KdpD
MVPLIAQGGPVGVLGVQSDQVDAFAAYQDFLRSLGVAAGLAVERLHEAKRRSDGAAFIAKWDERREQVDRLMNFIHAFRGTYLTTFGDDLELIYDSIKAAGDHVPNYTEVLDALEQIDDRRNAAATWFNETLDIQLDPRATSIERSNLQFCVDCALSHAFVNDQGRVRVVFDPNLDIDILAAEEALINGMVNLFENAKRASARTVKVGVALESVPTSVEFADVIFEDDGDDISEVDIDDSFRPRWERRPERNKGIGLYLNRRNMQNMGGDLSFARGPGGEKRFVVRVKRWVPEP